jgi:hypothetical protein
MSAAMRKAALLLRSLARADRAWLLSQLPAQQAAELKTLLKELERFGVDAQSASLALGESAQRPWVSPELGELQSALADVSPVWAARLLAAAQSPDTAVLLEIQTADRASAVKSEFSRAPRLPVALERAIREELERLRAQESVEVIR